MNDQTEPCRRCGEAGTERWYISNPLPALAGLHPKVSAKRTVGCDDCWEEFTKGLPS